MFALILSPCGECKHLGAAIDSGIRYCERWATWQWADSRVDCGTFEAKT